MFYETRKDKLFNKVNNILLLLITACVLYPIIFIMSASVSDPIRVSLGEVWLWPKGLTFEGYQRIFGFNPLWVGYRNTIFYTVVGTVINLFITLTCAYSLSRKDLVGRNFFTLLLVFTMFFHGGLIPTFLVVKKLGLVNTYWALLLPSAAFTWNIIITRTFFQTSIPIELQESAHMDGCSNTRLFLRIVLPLSKPIIAVMALFYGVSHWNSFFDALIYLSDRDLYPLQLILREILVLNQVNDMLNMTTDQMESQMKQMYMAEIMKYGLVIVSSLPLLIVYPFLQKYFMKGFLVGAIKG
ncbi:ABC transporter permease subunit [Paenibacillus sp. LMG 31461]|uniref:ABC transporter permease subunit n=1 Tax=Paenibacillus plantarum TaxID=2654975 RepID=A0ABX1XA79_9BACL|nr:ABC transporter permease subunit [Paenibacillus plantarum]NOU64850.1 ABC transporter permease subunit [Paenibacillus plantarum]